MAQGACPLSTTQEIPEARKYKTPILFSDEMAGPIGGLPGEDLIGHVHPGRWPSLAGKLVHNAIVHSVCSTPYPDTAHSFSLSPVGSGHTLG